METFICEICENEKPENEMMNQDQCLDCFCMISECEIDSIAEKGRNK